MLLPLWAYFLCALTYADAAGFIHSSPLRLRQLTRAHALSTATGRSEAAIGWGNPEGLILREVTENVWEANRPFMWNTIDVGSRMSVIKLKGASSPRLAEPQTTRADRRHTRHCTGVCRACLSGCAWQMAASGRIPPLTWVRYKR